VNDRNAHPAPIRLALALVPGYLDASLGVTLAIVQTANALCRAAGRPEAFELSLVAPPRTPVRSGAGLSVAAQPLAAARRADVLIVPGAFIEGDAAMQSWIAQDALAPWLALVRERHAAGAPIAASCAGTWLLAEAGALDGRAATTVWWMSAAFARRYPQVQLDTRAVVVSDGPVVTAGAALAHTDLMLHLVARWADAQLAERSARLLLADLREVQTRHVSLAWMAEADPLMRQACRWIDKHLAAAIDVEALARALHLTPRTLARRCRQALGVSPWRLVQRRRVESAVQLLRGTTLPFEKIALRVGYADASALRALIRREFGTTAAALRR
jgi:transcriptional regulator GlxA family with amidase domain